MTPTVASIVDKEDFPMLVSAKIVKLAAEHVHLQLSVKVACQVSS